MRAWQRMLSGRRLNLLEPSPLDIEIEDIAHGLSRVARWNGQTSGDWAYSVAQHSVLVETLLGRFRNDMPVGWRLAGLVHDAAEYVIGDLISPFKAAVGFDYKSFEIDLLSAIHIRIGLPAQVPQSAQNSSNAPTAPRLFWKRRSSPGSRRARRESSSETRGDWTISNWPRNLLTSQNRNFSNGSKHCRPRDSAAMMRAFDNG